MEGLSKKKIGELREIGKCYKISNQGELKKLELLEKINEKIRESSEVTLVWGTIEVFGDGYGFLRETNVGKDVYVSSTQIRKFKVRTGDLLLGEGRIPTGTEKNYALLKLITINNQGLEIALRRIPFEELTPSYPVEQLMLGNGNNIPGRIIDLIAPVGKGQRGLIVAPPKAGKTMLISNIANSIMKNDKDAEVWILLIDERPEEVTDIKETVKGARVIASTFDESPRNHIKVTEEVLEEAKREVEKGRDIIILMDSITRLARAYNIVVPSSGKIITGGIDPTALYYPKNFFGAARNIRGGGSLTILATTLVDTGSKMDEIIYEEFKGTGNMELHLDRNLSELRIFPAIDIKRSGTRREELLLDKDVLECVYKIRRHLNQLNTVDSIKQLIGAIKKTENNKVLFEFFFNEEVKSEKGKKSKKN